MPLVGVKAQIYLGERPELWSSVCPRSDGSSGDAGLIRDTYRFANSHPQLCGTSEVFGQGSGDGDISHGDDFDRNSLLPSLPEAL